ncbi:hypothetical protein T484DRAFT_1906122 [Baffinella frigidus]|nr:hypothetical protein T484DRAFT_1906122 [Cryptophyta sp. CCMP2293]
MRRRARKSRRGRLCLAFLGLAITEFSCVRWLTWLQRGSAGWAPRTSLGWSVACCTH